MPLSLYGGSFDPPHLGHINAGRRFLEDCRPEKLLIIPAGDAPLKPAHAASAADRLAMCRLAFRGLPQTEVSDIEMRRAGMSYTIDTVEAIHRQYPTERLILLIGADQLVQFPHWHRWEDILSLAAVYTLPRTLESSSEIRRRLTAGEDAAKLLPPAVYQYIQKKGLYGTQTTA